MKALSIFLGLMFSLQSFANTSLICTHANSHSVYQLDLPTDLQTTKLTFIFGDPSVKLGSTGDLNYNEGESSPEEATYEGTSTTGLNVVLLFDRYKAAGIQSSQNMGMTAYYQQFKGDILSGHTDYICTKK